MSDGTLPPDFSVVVESGVALDIVRIVGDLDMLTVIELQLATDALVAQARTVLYDLGQLTFVDSSGLHYFVSLQQAAQRSGFTFTLTRPRHRVYRAFEVTNLDEALPWVAEPGTNRSPSTPQSEPNPPPRGARHR